MINVPIYPTNENLSPFEDDLKIKKLRIPTNFLKLLIQKRDKIFKNEKKEKKIRDLISKQIFNINYPDSKNQNLFLPNKKHKSTDKCSISKDNTKMNSQLPIITSRRTLFNLRIKENITNKDKIKNSDNRFNNVFKCNNQEKSFDPNRKNNNKQLNIFEKKNMVINKDDNLHNIIETFINNGYINYCNKRKNTFHKDRYQNNNTNVDCEPNNYLDDNILGMDNNIITDNNLENIQEKKNFLYQIKYNKHNKNIKGEISLSVMSRNNEKYDKTKINQIINNDVLSSYNNKGKINKKSKPEDNNIKVTKTQNNIDTNINNITSCKETIKHEFQSDKKIETKNKRYLITNLMNINKENNLPKPNFISQEKNNTKNKYPTENGLSNKCFQIINSFSTRNNKLRKVKKHQNLILSQNYKIKYSPYEDIQKLISKKMILFPLSVNISLNNSRENFYYFINKMYRNQLVGYMKHRENWELITKNNNDGQKTINFVWKYLSNRVNFKNFKYEPNKPCKKLKMINLFERNNEVGNKKNMFINLINYCDQINVNTFELVPFTIVLNNTKDVEDYLQAINQIVDFVSENKNYKNDLITNRKYNEQFWFDKNFQSLNKQYININRNFLSCKNYWILKPTDLYQGKCIEICSDFEEISKKCKNMFKGVEKKFIPELIIKEEEYSDDDFIHNIRINKNFTEENKSNILENSENNIFNTKKKIAFSKMYCSNEIIIQKYLDRPLLYYKRKFDIRCFVLVDSNLNIFFCREGHMKGSSEYYDLNNNNKLIHITNY